MPDVVHETYQTSIRITLPEEVLSEYESQAATLDIPVERIIAQRLAMAANYTSDKPLYFSDEQRQALEHILGRNVLHTQDALLQIRNAMSVRLGKVVIPLHQTLLMKLKSRCLGMDWEDFIKLRVTIALEQYVGMR
jgi:hypothetical protein